MDYPNKSHKHTEKFKREHSERMKGEGNSFFGRTHSDETVALISSKRKGKSKGSIPRLAKYGVTEEQYSAELESGKRWCSYKKHFAPLSDFAPRFRTRKQGGVCNKCEPTYRRNFLLKQRYGVEPDWYEKKITEQGGRCATCECDLPLSKKNFLAIDHNHETNEVRGILCARCNLSLARFEVVPSWAERAIAYLRKYGTEPK